MLSHNLDHRLDRLLCGFLSHIHRLGISPNFLTITSVVVAIPATILFSLGQGLWGGLILLISGLFDILDGALVRMQGKVTRFGGFLDSVLDRYVDLGILCLLLWEQRTKDTPSLDAHCHVWNGPYSLRSGQGGDDHPALLGGDSGKAGTDNYVGCRRHL
jgi:hypothetical protein